MAIINKLFLCTLGSNVWNIKVRWGTYKEQVYNWAPNLSLMMWVHQPHLHLLCSTSLALAKQMTQLSWCISAGDDSRMQGLCYYAENMMTWCGQYFHCYNVTDHCPVRYTLCHSVTAEAVHQEVKHTLDIVYKLCHKNNHIHFSSVKSKITYLI